MQAPTLSIIIPAYNESRRLPATIRALGEFLKREFVEHEVIIVDDGSRDDTRRVAEELTRTYPDIHVVGDGTNRGKGAALRAGLQRSRGEYVLMTDADLSTPLSEVRKLLARVRRDGYDAAIGSRALPDSDVVPQPWYRRVLGRAGNLLIRLVLGLPYRDTQCGFKLYRRAAALKLFAELSRPRFSFDYEVLLRAKKFGLRVAEVGVRWRHSALSTVRLRDVFECLIDVFRVRLSMNEQGQMKPLRSVPVLRFVTVGFVNTAVDATVYIILTRTLLFAAIITGPAMAKFGSFVVATLGSFILNRYWTFRMEGRPTIREIGRFYAATSVALAANVGCMYALVHFLHVYDIAALALTTIVTFGINYTLSRRWVFAPRRPRLAHV